MTAETRLGDILDALGAAGVRCLVMGGHAVRFYGLARNTNDYDLHVAPEPWDDLAARLVRSPLFAAGVAEGPSWRGHAFKRFRIGALPGGADEWLEFWRENHLLPPHAELVARSETGRYGGREVPFLGLPDLIRSKETERDKDWDDVSRLEEFLDARLFAAVRSGAAEPAAAFPGYGAGPGSGRTPSPGRSPTGPPSRRRWRPHRTR